MAEFILINGKFHKSEEKLFTFSGAGTFLFEERVRSIRNKIAFYSEIVELLVLKFRLLNQSSPDYLQNNGAELQRQIERFLSKNKLFKSAVISLKFFKEEAGTKYIVSAKSIESFQYDFNKTGLQVDVFEVIKKPVSELSALSFGSERYWEIAKNRLSGSGLDEYLIQNIEGKIIESTERNIYLIKEDDLFYPAINSGTFIDVSLPAIINIAKQLGWNTIKTDGFSEQELMNADELFIANSLVGIQWILGLRGKRYYNVKSKIMLEKLNNQIS